MGNQGHTYDDNRVLKEWIEAGVIGKVKEIHVWTNRPIWPQGKAVVVQARRQCRRISTGSCGSRRRRTTPIRPDIHPFKWRGFLEWGAGAHRRHGLPPSSTRSSRRSISACRTDRSGASEELTDIAWPRGAMVKYHWKNHPKLGDVTLTWYEGKNADGTQKSSADSGGNGGIRAWQGRLPHRRQRRRDL